MDLAPGLDLDLHPDLDLDLAPAPDPVTHENLCKVRQATEEVEVVLQADTTTSKEKCHLEGTVEILGRMNSVVTSGRRNPAEISIKPNQSKPLLHQIQQKNNEKKWLTR